MTNRISIIPPSMPLPKNLGPQAGRCAWMAWPGMFGRQIQMQPLAQHFRTMGERFYTVEVAHPNTPKSGMRQHLVEQLVPLVVYLVDHHRIDRLIPMGHSKGGALLGMLLTALHRRDSLGWVRKLPDKTRLPFLAHLEFLKPKIVGAVAIEPGPSLQAAAAGLSFKQTPRLLTTMILPAVRSVLTGAPFSMTHANAVSLLMNESSLKDQAVGAESVQGDSAFAALQLAMPFLCGDLLKLDPDPGLPVLVIAGGKDRVVSVKSALKTTSLYPNGELQIHDDADHWIIGEERSKALAAGIMRWYRERFA